MTTPQTSTTTTEEETPTTTANITDTPSIPQNPVDQNPDAPTSAKTTDLNPTIKTTTPISTTLQSEGMPSIY